MIADGMTDGSHVVLVKVDGDLALRENIPDSVAFSESKT